MKTTNLQKMWFQKNTKSRETVPLETDSVEVSVSTVFPLSFQMIFKLSLWIVSVYLCVVVPILELFLWVFLFSEFVYEFLIHWNPFSGNAEFLLVKMVNYLGDFKKYVIAISVVYAPFCKCVCSTHFRFVQLNVCGSHCHPGVRFQTGKNTFPPHFHSRLQGIIKQRKYS